MVISDEVRVRNKIGAYLIWSKDMLTTSNLLSVEGMFHTELEMNVPF